MRCQARSQWVAAAGHALATGNFCECARTLTSPVFHDLSVLPDRFAVASVTTSEAKTVAMPNIRYPDEKNEYHEFSYQPPPPKGCSPTKRLFRGRGGGEGVLI